MSRKKATLLSLLMLVGVVGISIGAAFLKNAMADASPGAFASPAPLYGEQGLPYGQTLSMEPLLVDDEYVYFKDRVLERFFNHPEANRITAQSIGSLVRAIPQEVRTTVMLVPLRIATEPAFAQYTDDSSAAIREIYEALPAGVETLDVTSALLEHGEEYIFFRTDDFWTALGSYYGARLYGESIGLDMLELDAYEDYRFEFYLGVFASLDQAAIESQYTDYVAYYILKDAANWQTVTIREGPSQYAEHQSPAVALSRRGTDIFVAGYYSHSILQGDGANGKTLLVIGDSNAKLFAPWFTPYYETVYLVNGERYQNGAAGLQQIFMEYNVTDCVILEGADQFGETPLNQRMRSLGGGK